MNKPRKKKVYTSTMDQQRLYAAKAHQLTNPIAITYRECFHNAKDHGATMVHMFHFMKDNKPYVAFGHNGTPFLDEQSMLDSMEFNKTGGNGVQGSGGKAVMSVMSVNKDTAEYLIHSKCQDGINTTSLSFKDKNGIKLQEKVKSDEWNDFLAKLLYDNGRDKVIDVYQDFTVIYIYRLDNPLFKIGGESPTSDKRINNFMNFTDQAQDWVNKGNKIHYNVQTGFDENNPLRSRHKAEMKKVSLRDDFCIKKFEIPVKNVQFKDDGSKVINLNATVTLEVQPNITYEGKEKALLSREKLRLIHEPEGESITKPYYYGHKTIQDITDYNSHGLFVYNDLDMGSNNSGRYSEEICYAESHKASRHSFESMGANRPLISKQWDVNISKLKEYLGNSFKYLKPEDFNRINKWVPSVTMKIVLHDVNDMDDIGSIDNVFYVSSQHVMKKAISAIMEKANFDNCETLQEYNSYIKDFMPPEKDMGLLSYSDSKSKVKLDKLYAIVQESSLRKIPDFINAKVDKNSYLKKVPVGLIDERIQVTFVDDDRKQITGMDIETEKPGVAITRHPTKDGIYEITTRELCKDGKGINELEIIDEEEYKPQIPSHYPRRKNHVRVGEKMYELDFTVDTPKGESSSGGNSGSGGGNTGSLKEDDKIYFTEENDRKCLVKWSSSKKKILLNNANPKIYTFAENGKSKEHIFSRVYKMLNEEAFKHCYKINYTDEYGLSVQGNTKFVEVYGSYINLSLNLMADSLISNSKDVEKLRESHIEYKKEQEEREERERIKEIKGDKKFPNGSGSKTKSKVES
jgi:hypothetical protein